MSNDYILCIRCRSTFTEEQTRAHPCCPKCGSKGVPGDTRKKATLTLTHHEWRILFMWADNWAGQCDRQDENSDASGAIQALAREARKQEPDFQSCLSLLEEAQELANAFGKVKLLQGDDVTVVEPEKKH